MLLKNPLAEFGEGEGNGKCGRIWEGREREEKRTGREEGGKWREWNVIKSCLVALGPTCCKVQALLGLV